MPFVAKAVGHPIAKYASLVMGGKTLFDINFTEVGGGGGAEVEEDHRVGLCGGIKLS